MANNVNVVNRGFEYICQWMIAANNQGGASGYTIPSYIGWGTANGSNPTSVVLPASGASTTIGTGQWSDIGPYSEAPESRTLASPITLVNDSVGNGTITSQFVGTITCTQGGGEAIGESFLVFGSSKPATFTVTGNAVTSGAAAMTVNTSGALANQYYQMNNEVIKISSTSASNVWNISRAQNGSSANAAAVGNTLTFGNIPGAGAANPSNGDLFAHAGFVALSLNQNDSIQFTWQVGVTS